MTRQVIDGYELGEVLGVGTVGTIYAATDLKTGQSVAIKKLHPQVSQQPLIRARFRREMLVLDRLRHPNIIAYLGGGEHQGQLYYVMERLDCGTVKEILQQHGPLLWPIVIEIGRQVCSALQFIHNHGVVHRDIKPSNLFLTEDAVVKLGDFGIARDLRGTDLTSSDVTVGTHAYMAPEQIRGDQELSGKADLYSLGCCLFEMMVGRTPFVADSSKAILDLHLHAEPPHVKQFVVGCPDELDRVIWQMLAKDPDDRPFNARAVQGVMSQLAQPDKGDGQRDLGASVAGEGRELLRQLIRTRHQSSADQVGWPRLLAVALVVAILAVVAALWAR